MGRPVRGRRGGEDLRAIDLVQRDEWRGSRVDALEALARVNAWNGQQAMLMRDVPRLPFGAPRSVEQCHFDHVDHTAHATACVAFIEVLHRPPSCSHQHGGGGHAVEQGGGHRGIAIGPAYCIARFERVEALDQARRRLPGSFVAAVDAPARAARTATPSARWSRFRPSSCGMPEREQMRTECGRASRRKR